MRATLLLSLLFFGPSLQAQTPITESGALMVYSDLAQGKLTASGIPYERSQLSAAHATLPFGTWVRVANFETEKMIDVVINDRKNDDGSLLILSQAAADKLRLAPNAVVPGSLLVLPAMNPAGASQVETAAPKKGGLFSALFGKEQAAPPAALPSVPPAPQVPNLPIPSESNLPAVIAEGSEGLSSIPKKLGGWLSSKSTPPPSSYPDPLTLPSIPSLPNASELLPMSASTGQIPVPGVPAIAAASVPLAGQAIMAPPSGMQASASPSAPYRVQFGAFRRVGSAEELSGMLNSAGIPTSVFLSPEGNTNIVLTNAGFPTAEAAQQWIEYESLRRGWTERPVVIR